jgi:hypothetical protein
MPDDNATELKPGTRAYDLAVSATNQPNLPAPRQQDVSAPPDIAGPPASPAATTLGGNPQPARPSPQQQAAAADMQHHSALGKIASVLLGKQTEYNVDPQTGKTVATAVPEKPGDFFRHLVVGAMLGAAAAKGQRSAIGGFAAGGAASIQANQQQDQQRYARAQQQFQNQQTADKATQEKLQSAAQHEFWNREQIVHERDANLRDAEFIQKTNENSQQMQKWAQEVGGIVAPIPGNGDLRNGQAMMKLFTSDPDKFRPPAGYDRFITHDIDTSGLTHDQKGGWLDGDGDPVNLEDRTTWRISFIPQKPRPIEIDGAKLNSLFPKTLGGLADPKQTYSIPWNQVVGLAHNEHETVRKEDDEDRKAAREKRLKETSARDQTRKDQDEKRKQQLADQKANPQKPVKIGDIGIINGKRMMVTKLDDQGRAIAGVPAP